MIIILNFLVIIISNLLTLSFFVVDFYHWLQIYLFHISPFLFVAKRSFIQWLHKTRGSGRSRPPQYSLRYPWTPCQALPLPPSASHWPEARAGLPQRRILPAWGKWNGRHRVVWFWQEQACVVWPILNFCFTLSSFLLMLQFRRRGKVRFQVVMLFWVCSFLDSGIYSTQFDKKV